MGSPRALAQTLVDTLPPAQLLEVWFALTGALRSAYLVTPEPMIDCVRGHMTHPDGTTEYAFGVTKPVKVDLQDMPADMARQKGKGEA